MSDSSRPHGLQPTRLLRPWDFPGKSTGVGCHCLLQLDNIVTFKCGHQAPSTRLLALWRKVLSFQILVSPQAYLKYKFSVIAESYGLLTRENKASNIKPSKTVYKIFTEDKVQLYCFTKNSLLNGCHNYENLFSAKVSFFFSLIRKTIQDVLSWVTCSELLVTEVGLILFFGWLLLVVSPIWDMIKNFKCSYSGEKTFFFNI